MAKGGPSPVQQPGQLKILSQATGVSLGGLPVTQPQGYPAKAAMPKPQPATAMRPLREGPTGRSAGRLGGGATGKLSIPPVRWK